MKPQTRVRRPRAAILPIGDPVESPLGGRAGLPSGYHLPPMPFELKRHGRALAIGLWVVWLCLNVLLNATTVTSDFARLGIPIAAWEPWVWEGSSNLVLGLLIPLVLWLDRRVPLTAGRWRRSLAIHAAATIPFSLIHVAAMVGIRKLVYGAAGRSYEFGDLPTEFFYEYRKDVMSYVFILLVFYVWRRFMKGGDDAGAKPPVEAREEARPDFFVSRKFGREYVVKTGDIDWIEAAGNYVNLHCGADVFPVRGSMAAMERALDERRFVRIHRSSIVDVARIEAIVPLDSGDYEVRLKDGGALRMSRRYRPRLKAVFG